MSFQGHLNELERRHKALKRQIEVELHHPSGSDLHLLEMKRRKLHLKDEIVKLRETPPPTH